MQFVKPMPFREAVDKLGAKSPVGSAMVSSEWSDVPVALRERAIFSSQVENVRFLQRAQDTLDDFLTGAVETLPDGATALKTGSRADFVDQMREFALSEGMGPIDDESAGGLQDITSERRLGLIFNVNTTAADSYGYYRQGLDPAVLDEWPGMRFIRVQDVKEPRESHVQYENQVYLKGDPIWARINADFGVPWAPFGWGCGHDTEDADRDECVAAGVMDEGDDAPEVDVPDFNEGLGASVRGMEPDLLNKLLGEFGDQVSYDKEGEMLNWNTD